MYRSTNITDDIVYPMQKPLYNTIPSTIGIPITVDPINHIPIVNFKFSNNEFLSKLTLLIEYSSFKLSIKLIIYCLISCIWPSLILFIKITPAIIPTSNMIVTIIYSFKF